MQAAFLFFTDFILDYLGEFSSVCFYVVRQQSVASQ